MRMLIKKKFPVHLYKFFLPIF